MFTFHPLEFLIASAAGLILVAGLTLLALRRRNEILQEYLTPEEPDMERSFFRRRAKEVAERQEPIEEKTEESAEPLSDTVPGWGEAAQ